MSIPEPTAVVKAKALVHGARRHVKDQLDAAANKGSIDLRLLGAVKSIIDQGAVARRDLAECLAQLSPAATLGLGTSGEHQSPGLSKLQSALIEAALAEQQTQAGEMLEGTLFCPVLLEESLDNWLRAGEYRGRENSPLTEIARLVAQSSGSPEESLQTRLGLLVPITAAVHIWRAVHLADMDEQLKLGWIQPGEGRLADAPAEHLNAVG